MELLNESIINSHRFEIISTVLKVHYQNRNNLRTIISYSEFKETIEAFIEQIMEEYLENTKRYKNNLPRCIVKSMTSKNIRGVCKSKENIIIINEDVVKNIYYGKIIEFITLFHELNHFKVFNDLRLGKINLDLIRIAKEELICLSEEISEIKDIKQIEIMVVKSQYYEDNYKLYSEEKFVDNEAIKNFILFCKQANIQLEQSDIEYLENRVFVNSRESEKFLRDFRYNLNFNSYYLDFEKAFDILIKRNPKWTECPQLKIEYYLDENGQVIKRNKDELIQLQSSVDDDEIRQLIQEILDLEIKKRLDKKDFFYENNKIIKDNFYNKIENNIHRRK